MWRAPRHDHAVTQLQIGPRVKDTLLIIPAKYYVTLLALSRGYVSFWLSASSVPVGISFILSHDRFTAIAVTEGYFLSIPSTVNDAIIDLYLSCSDSVWFSDRSPSQSSL